MPDTYTPILGLTLPEVGSSRDTWGSKLNSDLTTLDTVVGISMPIGALLDFAGPQAPSGWLICDGRAVSRTAYSNLFAVIGTAWGAGDGTTTFNLPPAQGRVMVAPGTVIDAAGKSYSYTFTQQLGTVAPVLTQANLPNYNLVTDVQGYHSHGGATLAAGGHGHTTDAQGTHSHGGATGYMSADHTHSGATDVQGSHQHSIPLGWSYMNNPGGTSMAAGAGNNQNVGTAWTNSGGQHNHNFTTGGVSTNHWHTISADGNHAHNVYAVGDHTHGIYADGNHQHNIALGGGGAGFSVIQPVLVATKIIFAGKQAVPAALLASAMEAQAMAQTEADELAAIREELAALRAILAPPGSRARVMSSPMRGAH